MGKMLRLDIVSDFVCPWCFVCLLAILEATGGNPEIEIQLHPYFLGGLEGLKKTVKINKRDFYLRKWQHDENKVEKMTKMFNELLQSYGDCYTVDGIVSSSLNAHRVCEWTRMTKGNQAQIQVALKIFRAYHSQGQDLMDDKVLIGAAKDVQGIEVSQVEQLLASDSLEKEIVEQGKNVGNILNLGMWSGGVPHIICRTDDDRVFEISGAQEVSYFKRIFDKLLSRSKV